MPSNRATRAPESARRPSPWIVWIGVAALLGLGCDEYKISLRLKGEALERTISWWSDDKPADFSEEFSADLAKLYERPDEGPQHSFTGVFSREMPSDIGGVGWFTRVSSPMGSSSLYVERFRGTEDLASSIEQSRSGIDLFVDLADGWIASEMKPGSESEALRRLVRERVGPDLANLDVYGFVGQTTGSPEETWFRILQYTVDRGYIDVGDLPQLVRVFSSSNDKEMGRVFARLVATQMGVSRDAPIPDSLEFLADLDHVAESFQAHARQDDRFEKWAAARRVEGSTASDEKLVESWIEDQAIPLGTGMKGFIFGSWFAMTLDLTLELARPPIATNGSWDGEKGQVEWMNLGLPDSDEVTRFVYAAWVDPATEFQTTHFGRVILDGETLAQYAVWRAGLSREEAADWDGLLDSLAPGAKLEPTLASFRFAHEKPPPGEPGDELPKSHAKQAIDWVLEGLRAAPARGARAS